MTWQEIKGNIVCDYQNISSPDMTKKTRAIVSKQKKDIMRLTLDEVLLLTEAFLEKKNSYYTVIAYQIVFYKHKEFTLETYKVLERFVFDYISDWWDCDDLMTHAFTKLLLKFPEILSLVKKWTTHERFAVRRCVPVLLVIPARKGLVDINDVFNICDLVFNDPHYLVQKGYGWLLKEASKKYQKDVIKYLEKYIDTMPRTAFRYALEKLPITEKNRLMSKTLKINKGA